MKPITVRKLSPAVAKAVRERARRGGISLNRAVAQLLEETTGEAQAKRRQPATHHDFDRFAGLWSKPEADAFDAYLKRQRRVHRKDRR